MKRNLSLFIIILIGLFSTIVSILINLASSALPSAFLPYIHYSWPLLGTTTLVLIILSVWHDRLQTNTYRSAPFRDYHHRQQLIKKVRNFWIKGVLDQSLHGAALIALGLHEQRDAVDNPWRLIFQHLDQPLRSLPPGTRITQVFDDSSGELLILGEPGSGKTTLLLELARDLLERAVDDNTHLIPVVFNLSSWSLQRKSIAQWLVGELNSNYLVTRKLAETWIKDDKILPLFDGLDEVALSYRPMCINAINAYRQEHGLVPVVLCSRSFDYFSQSARMLLSNAVKLQPLTQQQIEEYLLNAGEQLAGVRHALQKDPILQKLAQTPLMLSVLTLAYHGIPVEDIQSADNTTIRRQRVFATYVKRMLERRGSRRRYTSQQVMQYLTWLAQKMELFNQTEFSINKIQPDWLYNIREYGNYRAISKGTITGLVLGSLAGLICGAYLGSNYGLTVGLIVGLIAMLVFGSFVGLINCILVKRSRVVREYLFLPKNKTDGLVVGLIIGPVVEVVSFGIVGFIKMIFVLTKGHIVPIDLGSIGLLNVLVIGSLLGIFFGLLFNKGIYINSIILKLFLWHSGFISWNYIRFLDYATELILLRKVGNGYIFVHRLLQEFFITQGPMPGNLYLKGNSESISPLVQLDQGEDISLLIFELKQMAKGAKYPKGKIRRYLRRKHFRSRI